LVRMAWWRVPVDVVVLRQQFEVFPVLVGLTE
jgi:hypothetical protein